VSPYSSAARSYAAVGTQSRVTENDPHGLILLLFDGAIERIRKAIEGFEEISTCATTTQKAAERILRRAKIMEESLVSQVETIAEEALKLKARVEES